MRIRVTCQECIGGYMPRGSRLDGRPAGTVNLIGERLCLDFVNSVGARRFSPSRKMSLREEKLNDYLDLLAWGRHAGALTNADAEARAQEGNSHPREAVAVFHRAIRLREKVEWTRLRRMRCRCEWNCKPIALPASGRTAPKQSGNSSNLVMLRLPCRPLRQSEMIVCNDGPRATWRPTHSPTAPRHNASGGL